MLIRFLMFLVITWGIAIVAVWLVAAQLRKLVSKNTQNKFEKNTPQSEAHSPQSLVACQACGVYLPKEEAIDHHNCYYCSIDCQTNNQIDDDFQSGRK